MCVCVTVIADAVLLQVDGEMDPSDLGQYDMADVYLSLLPPILQAS